MPSIGTQTGEVLSEVAQEAQSTVTDTIVETGTSTASDLEVTRDPSDPEKSLKTFADASTQTDEEGNKEEDEEEGGGAGEKRDKGKKGEDGEKGGGAPAGSANPPSENFMEDIANPALGNLGIDSGGQKSSQ